MAQLIAYLNSGHPVYAEGCDFGFGNNPKELWPFFGASYLRDGQPGTTGNVQTLAGKSGCFAQGMSLDYAYQQGPDTYVDEFGAAGGRVVMSSQDGIGRVVSNETLSCRTVLSSTIFGATSGPDRAGLMAGIMEYLVFGTGIGQGATVAPAATARITPSVARAGHVVRLQTSGPARELAVLDALGRVVTGWQVPAGEAVTAWNVDADVAPGAYFLQVRAGLRATVHQFAVVR